MSAKGPLLTCWLILVIIYIILSCYVPPALTASGANKMAFYIPMFILICPILASRMFATSVDEPALMFAGFCCVLAPSLLGCALTLFGAGEYYSLANGAEATGSIASTRDLLAQRPRPSKFYFTDGYVAKDLTVSDQYCSKGKNGQTTCTTYALAPVYTDEVEYLEKGTVYAWALPAHHSGTEITSSTCEHESGAGGLCGTMMPYEHIDYGAVVDRFRKEHPKIEISEDLPYIMFTDPAESQSSLKGTMIAGIVLLCIAMALTLCEALADFKGNGGFRTRSIADKLMDTGEDEVSEDEDEEAAREVSRRLTAEPAEE
eukprot:gnl/MRDRNA2_/MRDRNA2_128186_c0_seq1.p1 gnl/MRDRNA2_/MRDRNA2_128186_c0~~gnl/MRDRNA2_/MRDRNA2_128186_c0_seq1.p1  ORF type:complete len:317 (-),score=46.33 gnl/MRDRNA2_/MRDRNA2_128186_c0_seq1:79-1029(-)